VEQRSTAREAKGAEGELLARDEPLEQPVTPAASPRPSLAVSRPSSAPDLPPSPPAREPFLEHEVETICTLTWQNTLGAGPGQCQEADDMARAWE